MGRASKDADPYKSLQTLEESMPLLFVFLLGKSNVKLQFCRVR
jgi:hypothetical protein